MPNSIFCGSFINGDSSTEDYDLNVNGVDTVEVTVTE